MGIPNGIPLIFKFKLDGNRLVPVKQELAEAPLSGEFLEKKVSSYISLYQYVIFYNTADLVLRISLLIREFVHLIICSFTY